MICAATSVPAPQTQALTAAIIIDSLGRRWNPALHPRDRKGRFIETFAEIRGFMKRQVLHEG